MTQIEGIVKSARIEQEGRSVVLRFVLEAEVGDRVPVEMRGRKVLGVLEDGDRVRLQRRGRVRGRDGVARPKRLSNLSTDSAIRVPRRSFIGSVLNFILSVIASVVSGWLSSALIGLLTLQTEPVLYSFEEGPEAIPEEPLLAIPLLVGLAVAGLVFFLVWVRPRLRGN